MQTLSLPRAFPDAPHQRFWWQRSQCSPHVCGKDFFLQAGFDSESVRALGMRDC